MSKQKKLAMQEQQDQREQPRLGPKQCPRQFCQAWMDSRATECPYCNHPMQDFQEERCTAQRMYAI